MNVKVFSRLVAIFCSAGALASVDCGTAESAQRWDDGQAEVPNDTCLFEVIASEDVTITIDGHDFGTKREFTFDGLEPGSTYASTLSARFADGSLSERNLLVRAGWHARLSLQSPISSRPKLVVQTDRGWVQSYALSPDGNLFAYGTQEGVASVWDVATGRRLRTFRAGAGAIAFSADSRRLVMRDKQGGAVWDIASGTKVKAFRALGSFLQFSPDGRYVVMKGSKELYVCDVSTGRLACTIPFPEYVRSGTREVAFQPDGRHLAVAWGPSEGRRFVTVYDASSGEKLYVLEVHGAISAIAYSPNGAQIAAGTLASDKSFITVWDAEKRTKLWDISTTISGGLAFGPEGRRIAVGGYLRGRFSAFIIDAADGAKQVDLEMQEDDRSGVLAFSPDGQHVLTQGTVFDSRSGKRLKEINGMSRGIHHVSFGPDGTHILVGNALWDLKAGCAERAFDGIGVRLSPDGRYIASQCGSKYEKLGIWNARSGQRIYSIDPRSSDFKFSFTPDIRQIITASKDTTVWDLLSGGELQTFDNKGHHQLMSFSPDGDMVITADGRWMVLGASCKDLTARDPRTWQALRTFGNIKEAWGDVVFTPDGRYAITGVHRTDLLMFDPETGRTVRTFQGPDPDGPDILSPKRGVRAIAVSPDSSTLAATYTWGLAVVWDVAGGHILRSFQAHDSWAVDGCAFSSNGRLLMTGASAGMAKLWDLATGCELLQLVNVDDQGNWLVTTPEGLFDGSEKGRQAVTFRVGGGLNVVPVDRFFQDFYYPGLLAAIWRGERPMPTTKFADKLAPAIQIISPEHGGTVDSAQLELQVDVTDRGGGVKGPWLLQNGARVLSPGNPVPKGKTVERTFEVALIEGDNRIEVCAASEDGSWESEPEVITFTYDKPVAKPQLHLVAVGVNQYAEETMRLKFAADDATAVAQLFTTRGPALYGAGRVHVTHVLDNQATSDGIRRAIEGVAKQAKPQDTFLLFLAGHGTTIGQRYYFIPHDFKHQSDRLDEDIRKQGLAGDVVGDWVGSVPALKRIVIFDTCQSGATIRLPIGTRNPFAFRGALERLSRAQGLFTIAAASASEEAQEVDELGHGVLTYALLAGLAAVDEGPLKNQHVKTEEANTINVREWFGYAQDKVPLLTKLHFGQEQFVGFSGQGQSFPVLPLE